MCLLTSVLHHWGGNHYTLNCRLTGRCVPTTLALTWELLPLPVVYHTFIAEPRRRPLHQAATMNNPGLLPPGVHDMSLEKVGALCGSYQQNDQRPRLFAKLEELVIETRAVGLVRFLIINGSIVTSKPAPGDFCLIIVVEPGILDQRASAPRECILLSRNRLRRKYPVAVFVMPLASTAYNHYLDFLAKVKGNPGGAEKGINGCNFIQAVFI
jgi:hypothetical protein